MNGFLEIIGIILFILGIVLMLLGLFSDSAKMFIIGGLSICSGVILMVMGSAVKPLEETSKSKADITIKSNTGNYIEKRVVLDQNQDTVSITYIYKNENI